MDGFHLVEGQCGGLCLTPLPLFGYQPTAAATAPQTSQSRIPFPGPAAPRGKARASAPFWSFLMLDCALPRSLDVGLLHHSLLLMRLRLRLGMKMSLHMAIMGIRAGTSQHMDCFEEATSSGNVPSFCRLTCLFSP